MKTLSWWSPEVGENELLLVRQVLESQYINEGEVTDRFERLLAERLGVRFAVGTTSGTVAIFLALKALGVGAGDEVIVPDVTFVATANAVVLTGARPVLVDIDAATLNLDPAAARSAITSKTKAVVPVHVSGRGADMIAIGALAREHGLLVVEDAAEALLSRKDGRLLGTFGHAGCFSFSPNKTITTGQGGLVVTDDETLARRVRELKDQGRPVRGTGGDDVHATVGFNFKLTNLQSAVGIGQLDRLEGRAARLRDLYRAYSAGLQGVRQVRLPGFAIEAGEQPQWTDAICDDRDDLDAYLRERKCHCRRFWHPIHTQAPYLLPDDRFPNSTRLCARAMWLPSAFQMTTDDVALVCNHIRAFYSART